MIKRITLTLALLLFTLSLTFSVRAQGTAITALAVQVVLLKINRYQDYNEIREAIVQFEGVHRVVTRTASPGLLTLGVEFSGNPKELTASLQKSFENKYQISQKTLPSGATEINVSK